MKPVRSKFFQAKIAFSLPVGLKVEVGQTGKQYPDDLVEALMDLFESTTFEGQSICAPGLLIVDLHRVPTAEWAAKALAKINAVLLEHQQRKTK